MLGVFGLLILFLFIKYRQQQFVAKNILTKGSVFLVVSLIFSSPWYIYNLIRLGHPLAILDNSQIIGFPLYPVKTISLANFLEFMRSLTRTIFRGEFIWRGNYFDVLPLWVNDILITILPLIFFIFGLGYLFKISSGRNGDQTSWRNFFLIIGASVIVVLLIGYFFIGKIPYYQGRLVFCCLYFVIFVFGAGWIRKFKENKLSLVGLAGWFLIYNFLVMVNLLQKVFFQK